MSATKPKLEPDTNDEVSRIVIDPHPTGRLKCLGGAEHDDWNNWIALRTAYALPIDHADNDASNKASGAVCSGMIDLKPADPVEGILISQLMAANQASLSMYERAWAQPPQYFEARTRYLALADKAARTVALLTERLDHHRGRGQQKIVVQHVTTNNVTADQAMITDSLVTNKPASNVALKAVAASAAKPMPPLDETKQRDLVGVGGGTRTK